MVARGPYGWQVRWERGEWRSPGWLVAQECALGCRA